MQYRANILVEQMVMGLEGEVVTLQGRTEGLILYAEDSICRAIAANLSLTQAFHDAVNTPE